MKNAIKETVEDIVREMRKRAEEVYAGQAGYPESWKDQMNDDEIREIADRIEAAEKRENARLLAALKPVLDIEMDMYTSNLSMEMAINEAKRIYKESGESEYSKGGITHSERCQCKKEKNNEE